VSQATKLLTNTYEAFKILITQRFQPLAESRIARTLLFKIQQTGTVSSYATSFITLLQQVGTVDNETQMYLFRKGLKNYINIQLAQHQYTNLDELMTTARMIEANYTTARYIQQSFTSTTRTTSHPPTNSDMDIDAVAASYDDHEQPEEVEEKSVSTINNIQIKRPTKLTPEERERDVARKAVASVAGRKDT